MSLVFFYPSLKPPMERLLLDQLLFWKAQSRRNPILLDGARQVGKSFLLRELFGKRHFRQVHMLDLQESYRLHRLFDGDLKPDHLLARIELELDTQINPLEDLLLFDEIGECQRALDSLKYFAEQKPNWFVSASCSNIGLLQSFPVGKADCLTLFPLSFEEFLMASGKTRLLDHYREMNRDPVTHDHLWQHLLDYYYVGGMPDAVATWFGMSEASIKARCDQIALIHRNLMQGHESDLGKYAGRQSATDIYRVFRNVPQQLARNIDDSVKRFRFRGVLDNKTRYTQLRGPIDWLEITRLVSKCHLIDARPASPLKSLTRENIFKLFFFDTGLLGFVLELSYQEQINQKAIAKGFIAENFVQNELLAAGAHSTYSWQKGQSEIEFLYSTSAGNIIPVEVKSGTRTRARSLRAYKERYQPRNTLKLIGGVGGNDPQDMVWPLYYAQFLTQF